MHFYSNVYNKVIQIHHIQRSILYHNTSQRTQSLTLHKIQAFFLTAQCQEHLQLYKMFPLQFLALLVALMAATPLLFGCYQCLFQFWAQRESHSMGGIFREGLWLKRSNNCQLHQPAFLYCFKQDQRPIAGLQQTNY